MRRITITLTDEEYEALERRAAEDRRTPREMAAYLVTRAPQPIMIPLPYYPPAVPLPWSPIQTWQPTWTSDRTTITVAPTTLDDLIVPAIPRGTIC